MTNIARVAPARIALRRPDASDPPAGTLTELGIRLRDERPGERRTACPECAKAMGLGPEDRMGVVLDKLGVEPGDPTPEPGPRLVKPGGRT